MRNQLEYVTTATKTNITQNFGTVFVQDTIWDNDRFVAVGTDGTLRTSTDGLTWTSQTVPSGTNDLNRVLFNKWAVGERGVPEYIAVGEAWSNNNI
ncbi:MAG: hypothetical protein CM15mV5_2640 [uncultured marine virus]|nr:MAG: hypothetical protein CM15mV5_2640 [uncultured marine virus]